MLGNAAGAGGLNAGPDLETIQTEVSECFCFARHTKVTVHLLRG